ncbi:MAG: type II toxin-antitoxin system RelE/ParE family toxin [Eubacterium sp.]|nr:type II toxin-antitoxin system RelE/ParE family toxin [Eubacterium sp.]
MFQIDFYRLPNGKAPVEEFLDGLNVKMRNKALDSLLILEEFGNTLREPYSKSIGNGLFELRIKFSNDISRIFYFFYTDNRIVVTNGFIKKTQKTPKSQIISAYKYKADYERRIQQGAYCHE